MDSPTVISNIIGEENSQIITTSTEIEIPQVSREAGLNSAKQSSKKKKPYSQKNANIDGGNSPQITTDLISTKTEAHKAKVTKRMKAGSDNAKQPPKKQKTSNQKNTAIVEGNGPQKIKDGIATKTKISKATERKADNAQEPPKTEKPSTSHYANMIVEAINSLKIRKGAPKEAIMQYLEENHGLDKKSEGRYVTRFLNSGCEKGVLEEVSEERFKVKKVEKAKAEDVKEVKSKAKRGVKTSN